jgi:hypothetical protein
MVTRKVISGVVLDLPASDQCDPQQSTFKIQVIPDFPSSRDSLDTIGASPAHNTD